ncbi:MAG: ATP-binding protein [Syntrophomonadaceae bacterium]|nr:ATP-binding protein [Syntrophomonadaceae bacterium]
MIKRETYIKQIRPFINKNIIKVLTGLRRSGKSVMLQLIQEELVNDGVARSQFFYMNFESAEYAPFKTGDALYQHLSRVLSQIYGKAYLFVDEIQEVMHWETCINSLLVDFDVDIYITGSNANLLSGELATYLAGRYVEIKVYPFSYLEFLDICRRKDENVSEQEAFTKYLQLGGMPFLINLDFAEEASFLYLRDIYNSVILKDVIQRNHIRDAELLERIIMYVIANVGHTFSAKSLSDFMKSENRKAAPETVYNYIKACENACLFHRVKRQDLVGKKLLQLQEKIYLTDHGIREAIYGKNSRDIDQVLENIVYMELLRRGYEITVGKMNHKEVDFAAEKRGEKLYVQVTYLLASEQVKEREFSALLAINDNYPKYVVSMDELDLSHLGIKHMNIRYFLQSKEL